MIPHITTGSSFNGGLYFLHDKGAKTQERVAWVEVLNLPTKDPLEALEYMKSTAAIREYLKEQAAVAKTGQKTGDLTFQISLAWHPEQDPDKAEMMEAALSALQHLEAGNRELFIACHIDEPQPHIHIFGSRIDPATGKALNLHDSQKSLSRWAQEHQRQRGETYCPQRVENNARRDKGEFVRYRDQAINRAWQQSGNGKSFAAGLQAEGHILARGDRRDFVIVDPQGKALNPARQIEGVRVKDIREKLADLDPASLPSVRQAQERQAQRQRGESKAGGRDERQARRQQAQATRKAQALQRREEARQASRDRQSAFIRDKRTQEENRPENWDRDAHERAQDEKIIKAALEKARNEKPAEKPRPERAVAWEKARFEAWAGHQRAGLQNRQLDEQGDLGRRHHIQRDNLNERLAADPFKQTAREKLEGIGERQEKGGFFYRMSGRAQADREEAEKAHQTLTGIEGREAEARGKLAHEQRAERTAQAAEQRRQDRSLEDRLTEAYERREREGWQPTRSREPANDQPGAGRGRRPGAEPGL